MPIINSSLAPAIIEGREHRVFSDYERDGFVFTLELKKNDKKRGLNDFLLFSRVLASFGTSRAWRDKRSTPYLEEFGHPP
ncbi:MAG: hypothetical protein LBR53_07825 [Deltaproteobacteria bacterium]|nr:hypothetical protein [Deltaproteobacteria bacterium]